MDAEGKNYLSIQLKGDEKNILLGTIIKCYTSDKQVMTEVYNPQRGFLSSSHHRLHFGLGQAEVDSLQVFWPGETVQILIKPEVNQVLNIEKSMGSKPLQFQELKARLFKPIKEPFEKHQENKAYSEFDYERLIDRSYSDFGPTALNLDYNNDGLQDLLIAGGKDQSTLIYEQTITGSFKSRTIPTSEEDKPFEDTALAIIDANQDGFQDILVGSGSNEHELTAANYPLRLYLFVPATQTFNRADFPEVAISTTKILVDDFDGDGMQDVFVAGRNSPKDYPKIPQSLVFQQTENGFVNKTSEWLPDSELGMLTDAVYEDLNQDGKPELLIVGEWMPPKVFQFDDGFRDVTQEFGFQDMKGLWESILTIDVNQDGKNDILLGNRGLNNIYKASPEQPLKMLVGDFDQNPTTDYLMFQSEDSGRYKPLLGYKRVASQLPKIRKDFNSYKGYANANWEEYLNNTTYETYEVNALEHAAFLNQGNNQFQKIKLPYFTQNSIAKAITSVEIGGKTYIILAGNQYDTDAEFTVYDASNGHVMIWNSVENKFDLIPIDQSGFIAEKDVREIKTINFNGKKAVLVLNNDGFPEMFVVE
jgi:hypothetical protein